jgi:hypothetical protein
MNYEFPLTGAINLDCRLGYGAISVHAVEDLSTATVALSARESGSDVAEKCVVEMQGRTLTVRGRKPPNTIFDMPVFLGRASPRDALDADISVPAGTAMKISSYGADLIIDGRGGSADIASGATTIRIENVDGDLRVRFGSGPVQVSRVSGTVVLRYGSGEAHLGEIGGALDMACGSGSLDVQIAHGSVRARTGAGRASVGCAYGDVDLTSGSGGLEVGLPPGQNARLDVLTGGGQLQSELDVHDRAPGGEAITVRTRTGSGNVRLFRAVA